MIFSRSNTVGVIQCETEQGCDAVQSKRRTHATRADDIGVTDQISLQTTVDAVLLEELEVVGDEDRS